METQGADWGISMLLRVDKELIIKGFDFDLFEVTVFG